MMWCGSPVVTAIPMVIAALPSSAGVGRWRQGQRLATPQSPVLCEQVPISAGSVKFNIPAECQEQIRNILLFLHIVGCTQQSTSALTRSTGSSGQLAQGGQQLADQ